MTAYFHGIYSFILFKFNFYWSLINLQCCVSFKCMATWTVSIIFHIIFHHRLLQDRGASQGVLCCVVFSCSVLSLCDLMDCSPPGTSVHGNPPGKNTGVGYHALLQGIFPIQGLNQVDRFLPPWRLRPLFWHSGWERKKINMYWIY